MAENINISFAPNKNADEAQRIADIENYLQTLTERTKFALSTIIENYNETDDNKTSQLKQNIALQSVSDSVGKFTDADKNCEIFNDYDNNIAKSDYAHAEGYKTSATAKYSHSEGSETTASGISAHAEGAKCTASSDCSHAEGYSTNALSLYTHAEGCKTSVTATAPYAHAEGYATVANAPAAHAEGSETKAEQYAHAEGCGTKATGYASHAEGHFATSSGDHSHAEGNSTVAQGINSHAEGNTCRAANNNTHAGGIYSDALGDHSFVHGYGVKISYSCGAGFGRRNKTQNALFVIGNGGWNEGTESDALTLDEHGNLYISGKFTAGGGIDIPIATAESVGGIKVGENLSISEDGTLSANPGAYTLPAATADNLGGVKIGDNIAVADDGTISVDLSTYLQSADIADWAKQPNKPEYTASEVGAAAEQHTHSTADITDFPAIPTKVSELQNDSGYLSTETDPTVPAWAKADTKPTYTATEVGAAEAVHTHSDISAVSLSGQTVDIDTLTASQTANKGKLMRYYCPVASAQNITNRPTTVNEPFTLEVRNIRWASESSYISVQRYISTSGKREYLRWCTNGTWTAWQATEIRTIYGTITQAEAKSYSYASYGVGYVRVKLTALYNTDSGANLVNIKAAALVSTSDFERTMLTVNGVSLVWKISAGGDVTIEVVGGTGSFTYELQYFIN